METADRPTPPEDITEDIRAVLVALGDEDPETIRAVASYTADLAEWAAETDEHANDATEPGATDGRDIDAPSPDGVPDDATVSVVEIAGTEYHYYQWRDGDSIRSETVKR